MGGGRGGGGEDQIFLFNVKKMFYYMFEVAESYSKRILTF